MVTPKSTLKSVPNDEYQGMSQPCFAFQRSSFGERRPRHHGVAGVTRVQVLEEAR